jgi:hypothetical protein
MEDNLKKKIKNRRRPQKKMKMEDDLNKTNIKWKTNQSTKIYLIGCDTIVNSPSLIRNVKTLRPRSVNTEPCIDIGIWPSLGLKSELDS